jgi:Ca2+-binding RTX toxin-like protein
MADYIGGDFGDTIIAGTGDDRIIGRGGNDTLTGGAGNDVFVYDTRGFRQDWITDFNTNGDRIDLSFLNVADFDTLKPLIHGELSVRIILGWSGQDEAIHLTNVSLASLSASDFIFSTSTSDLTVNGGRAGDSLTGNAGANALAGYEGNDTLRGGAGSDTLAGGTGADRFVYAAVGDSVTGANADRITDFSHAQGDRIDLSLIDANTGAAGNQAFIFIGSGLYTGVAGQLRFAQSGGNTTIAGDVNGNGTSDFRIILTGTMALQASDFVL